MSEAPSIIPPAGERPLAGRRIAVTSHRRAADLVGALVRQGAEVTHAATMRVVPVGEDDELVSATREMLVARPAALLVTTGQGFTAWLDALPEPVRHRTENWLRTTRILCRGSKARGAVRGRGFADPATAPGETTGALVDLALSVGVRDCAVGLQRHGYVDERHLGRLREAGCSVHVVAPYRWIPGDDQGAVRELIEEIIAGRVDATTFTAGPSVEALFATAEQMGRRTALQEAMRDGRTLAVAVGHVTAQPLQAEGIPVTWPERERMGALVRHLTEVL